MATNAAVAAMAMMNGGGGGSGGDVTKQYVDEHLALKVDKVEGKGLSTNDYTNSDKTLVNNFSIMWNTPEMHRMIFRGKPLGTSVSAAQVAAIRDGSFDDLYIGDYWVIDNVNWRVADMDYWLGCGPVDSIFNSHHLVIAPDTCLYDAEMNDTNTTTGGYVGSKMYTENLAEAKATINAAFPNLVLAHKECLVNAVSNGKSSGIAWFDSTIDLMNESMVYGHREFTPANDGTTIPYNYTMDKSQLALFQIAPKFITNRAIWWLRDIVSATFFADVSYTGVTLCDDASNSHGVRPVFAIG